MPATIEDTAARVAEAAHAGEQQSIVVWGAYLIAAALFILSLKWLSHPKTARRGVLAGEVGMALAVIGTLLMYDIVDVKAGTRGHRDRLGDRRPDGASGCR